MRLSNCPFQQLSDDHTDLVCPLNEQFVDAVAQRLNCVEVHPVAVERGTGCCVGLRSPTVG